MKNEIIFLVKEAEDGGFLAQAVGHDLFTDADSLDAIKINISEAVDCHFEGDEKPDSIRLQIVREEVMAL